MATEGTGASPARELGQGWKVSPCINIRAARHVTLADIDGPGAIQHIWLTVHPTAWRTLVLRIYWDGEETPSVEMPLGDFFCNGWGVRCNVTSLPVAVNPAGGFNSYWEMPFRKRARITLENLAPDRDSRLLLPDRLHPDRRARRRGLLSRAVAAQQPAAVQGRSTPCWTACRGRGTTSAPTSPGASTTTAGGARARSSSTWTATATWPTICGTGTEDYFGGAWNFEHPQGQYGVYSTPFLGLPQVIKPDGLYRAQQRFGMYRWHVMDPIRFEQDLRVTIQALGWRASRGRAGALPAAAGRHRLDGVLVPGGAARPLESPTRRGRARGDLARPPYGAGLGSLSRARPATRRVESGGRLATGGPEGAVE